MAALKGNAYPTDPRHLLASEAEVAGSEKKHNLRELRANAGCDCKHTFICMLSRSISAMDFPELMQG